MLTCKEVSRLVASGDLASQGLMSQLRVRLHLFGCDHCNRYARELKAIRAAARRLAASESFDPARLARLRESIVASLRGDKPE
jgi:anti-sigma factor RsiW